MTPDAPAHACFDIDGTLLQPGAYIDWKDPISVLRHSRPIAPAVRRLNQLLDVGVKVSFVSARFGGVGGLTDITHRQLRELLGERAVRGVDVILSGDRDYSPMLAVLHKFDALRLLKPTFYCGDLPEDQTAAAAAGVPFFPAEWFAAGRPLGHLWHPEYSPAAIRDAADGLGYTDGLPRPAVPA